jgi:hypothetical protein
VRLPERPSAYSGAPGWYWRIAFWCGGWRGEVQWWVALFLLGLLLGLVVGFIGGVAL